MLGEKIEEFSLSLAFALCSQNNKSVNQVLYIKFKTIVE